jgi:hypothetical protein
MSSLLGLMGFSSTQNRTSPQTNHQKTNQVSTQQAHNKVRVPTKDNISAAFIWNELGLLGFCVFRFVEKLVKEAPDLKTCQAQCSGNTYWTWLIKACKQAARPLQLKRSRCLTIN